jgi:hypothetical protein
VPPQQGRITGLEGDILRWVFVVAVLDAVQQYQPVRIQIQARLRCATLVNPRARTQPFRRHLYQRTFPDVLRATSASLFQQFTMLLAYSVEPTALQSANLTIVRTSALLFGQFPRACATA